MVPSSQESELADVFMMDTPVPVVDQDATSREFSKGKAPMISSPLRQGGGTPVSETPPREPNTQPSKMHSHPPLPLSNVSSPVRRHLGRVGDRITLEEAMELERDVSGSPHITAYNLTKPE